MGIIRDKGPFIDKVTETLKRHTVGDIVLMPNGGRTFKIQIFEDYFRVYRETKQVKSLTIFEPPLEADERGIATLELGRMKTREGAAMVITRYIRGAGYIHPKHFYEEGGE